MNNRRHSTGYLTSKGHRNKLTLKDKKTKDNNQVKYGILNQDIEYKEDTNRKSEVWSWTNVRF